MSSWIDAPEARRQLAARLNERYRRNKQRKEAIDSAQEQEKTDQVWQDACEMGRSNGKVRLCWLDLKHVSGRIYSFQSNYGRELRELVLDGVGLSTMESICEHCTGLTHISLAANHINDITGIHNLRKLVHLNLLRNSLTHLPSSIGLLVNLTRLDVANNRLVELPNEISQLSQLKHLNLECNELSELPSDLRRLLLCEVVILNRNRFRVFPESVLSLPRMRQISIMANELTNLPVGMRSLERLEVFRASGNRIMTLPDSLVEILNLECLWLDHNKLSALPPNFFRLRRLKVLKLEGNVDLIYPPIETVAMGVEEVLRWSMTRLEMKKAAKVRRIVQSLEEVSSLVMRHRVGGGLHESLFLVNGECYQFPPNAL